MQWMPCVFCFFGACCAMPHPKCHMKVPHPKCHTQCCHRLPGDAPILGSYYSLYVHWICVL